MADLSKDKLPKRRTTLKKVQESPMEATRIPVIDPTPKEASAPEPTRDVPPEHKKAPEAATAVPPHKPAPSQEGIEPPSDQAAPEEDETTRYRFPLQFDDPALKQEAEAIAKVYGVPLAHILKAILSELQITADDFRQASIAPQRKLRSGSLMRIELSLPTKDATAWLKLHDPLDVHYPSVVLRPVVILAFERAARRKLAALKKEK